MTALLSVTLDSSINEKFYTLPEQDREALVKKLGPRSIRSSEPGKIEFKWYDEILIDGETAQLLSDCGITFRVERFKGQMPFPIAKNGLPEAPVTHIHLPNFDLVSFNKVTYEEDCCTDKLQDLLDEGWRIIACCPPLSERRPTYILGRRE